MVFSSFNSITSFFIGGTEYLTILTGGNVGIGNNNPTGYKLDVNGSLNSTSLNISGRMIQTHLFNNSGRTHGTYTDFNTPTDFGCHLFKELVIVQVLMEQVNTILCH